MATTETERHARGYALLEETTELLRGGELPAAIFNDEDVFALEREKVFGRSWIYLGHESEIPEPGDYVLRYIARDWQRAG
jgi:PAH dioxygenase large subunit